MHGETRENAMHSDDYGRQSIVLEQNRLDDEDCASFDASDMTKRKQPVQKHSLDSNPAQSVNLRISPTSSTKDNLSRKPTFSSDFVTPGTIVDDSPPVSRNDSIGSMKGNKSKSDKKKEKQKSKRAASDERPPQGQIRKQSIQDSNASDAMQMNEAQHEKLREAFMIFDRDGDGRITRAEMSRVVQSLGCRPNDDEIKDMLDKADFNRNGTIEFEEFVQVMNGFSSMNGDSQFSLEDELRRMFEIFDVNKDGRITAQELSHVMSTLGENLSKSELDDMMRTADANGDGIIDFQEFQTLFRRYDSSMNSNPWAVSTH